MRSGGPTFYQNIQNIRNPLKTQPLIVSTVSTASSGNLLTSTTNVNQVNTFTSTPNQDNKEMRMQLTPEHRIILQRQMAQQAQQRANLNQQNIDANMLAQQQRQRRMVPVQRQVLPQQVNVQARMQQQFVQPASSPSPQSPMPMVQSHSYQMVQSPFSQPPSSPMSAPVQSPRSVTQFAHPSSSPAPSQSPQPQPPSPMQMASPRHVSQFVHSSSPAPPHSPIYSSQGQYMSHNSPIPARSPVLARRPPSVESYVQDNQQSDMHMNFAPDSYNTNPNNNNSNSGGGGGGGVGFVNTIPIPPEFVRLGIKPGLMGGSPTWNEKLDKNETKKVEDGVQTKAIVEDTMDASNASTSTKALVTATSTPIYNMDVDSDSVFSTYPTKLSLKPKSPNSLSDFESGELCTTPKTEDSIELYKDVPLGESCKSEENSLGIDDFPASPIVDNGIPLVLDTDGVHLTLDPNDEQNSLLEDCLVSSDLMDLNMTGEHHRYIDDTSEIGCMIYMNKIEDGESNKADSLIATEVKREAESEASHEPEKTKEDCFTSENTMSNEKQSSEFKTEKVGETNELEKQKLVPEEKSVVDPESTTRAIETNEADPPSVENESTPAEENAVNSSSTIADVDTTLPVRTTSVLQLASTVVSAPGSKDVAVTFSNIKNQIESFHSYVKKLPKIASENAIAVKEESSFEKDKQLFDETLAKIKTERLNAEMLEEMNDVPSEAVSAIESVALENSSPTSHNNTTNENVTVATKDSVPSPNIKKESVTLAVPVTSTPTTMFPPRTRPSDDSQNVLLKQLLQNAGSANITHSTMTQHVTKSSLVASPTHRTAAISTAVVTTTSESGPMSNAIVPVTSTNVSSEATAAIMPTSSEVKATKPEVLLQVI